MRALAHSFAAAGALAAAPLVLGMLAARPAWRIGVRERLGAPMPVPPGAIWIHAASVGEILAASVDLFAARPLHWLQAGTGFVLSLGDAGWLRLAVTLNPQGEDEWEAIRMTRQGDQRVLACACACAFSLAYAQGIAEDYARRRGAAHLVNPQAAWCQKAASERQKWLLDQLQVSFAPDLSSGAAADLISVAKLDEVLPRGCSENTPAAHAAWRPPRGGDGVTPPCDAAPRAPQAARSRLPGP